MTADVREGIYEEIRLGVNLEKYSPERMMEMWRETFGDAEKNNIRREKFKNVGGTLTTEEDTILEGAKLRTVEGESLLSWKNEGMVPMHLRVNDESSIGIQAHESGEKSLVVVRSSVDKVTGASKQTTRRFTAVK